MKQSTKDKIKKIPGAKWAISVIKGKPVSQIEYGFCEIVPVHGRKAEKCPRLRLNFLVPSVDEKHVFGGIATAMTFFEKLRKACDCDARMIVYDATVDMEHSKAPKEYVKVEANEESDTKLQIVPFYDRDGRTIPVCENDVFFATAWWTAYTASDLLKWQKETFGICHPLIYFIQDFEPGFYAWSSHYLLADSTYRLDVPTYAIFNSKLLAEYFENGGYTFEKKWSFDPVLNEELRKILLTKKEVEKKKQIIVYGRPSTDRNAFRLLVTALKEWAKTYEKSNEWTVLSAGEAHEEITLFEDVKLTSVGKLTLEEYANTMLETYAGVSLMVSPHPSYPPLEMSAFGIRTITNRFGNKDLSSFSKEMVSLPSCKTSDIAGALTKLCEEYKSKKTLDLTGDYVEGINEYDEIIADLKNLIG